MGKLGSWGIKSQLETPAICVRPAFLPSAPLFTPTFSLPESTGPCFKEEGGSLFPYTCFECLLLQRLLLGQISKAISPDH